MAKSTSATLIFVAFASAVALASFRLDRVTSVASFEATVKVRVFALLCRSMSSFLAFDASAIVVLPLAFMTTSCALAAVRFAPCPASIDTLPSSLAAFTVTEPADDFATTSFVASAAVKVTTPVVFTATTSLVSVVKVIVSIV